MDKPVTIKGEVYDLDDYTFYVLDKRRIKVPRNSFSSSCIATITANNNRVGSMTRPTHCFHAQGDRLRDVPLRLCDLLRIPIAEGYTIVSLRFLFRFMKRLPWLFYQMADKHD